MHIGLEATTLRSPGLGGMWRYTDSLVRALARRAGPHRYSLLFINKPWARVSPPDVGSPRCVSSTSPRSRISSSPSSARRFHAARSSGSRSTRSSGRWTSSIRSTRRFSHSGEGRRVVTIHDLTCLLFPQFHPLDRRVLFRLSVRRAARLADAIIVPSAATGRDLVGAASLWPGPRSTWCPTRRARLSPRRTRRRPAGPCAARVGTAGLPALRRKRRAAEEPAGSPRGVRSDAEG